MRKPKLGEFSTFAQKCWKMDKEEVTNLAKPVELEFAEARKLMSFSEPIVEFINELSKTEGSNQKAEFFEKNKNMLKSNYSKVQAFAKRHKECFEARKVLLMIEIMMLDEGIDPSKFAIEPEEENNFKRTTF